MMLRPRSLFGRTAITVALTLLAFMAIALGSMLYFVHIPLSKRYSDDFAAVIVSAAHSLQSVPEEMHESLRRQLLEDHGLVVAEETTMLADTGRDSTTCDDARGRSPPRRLAPPTVVAHEQAPRLERGQGRRKPRRVHP